MSKKPAGKQGKKAPQDLEDYTKDFKKVLDAYNKAADKHSTIPSQAIVRKFRHELQKYAESEEILPPNFPIIVTEPMDYAGVSALLEALKEYRFLRQLSFWKSSIGDDGAMVIAEFLKVDPRMAVLEILNSGMGVRGCMYLSRVLTQNDKLSTLLLDHNLIGDEGVAQLGDGLKWNSNLHVLSLQYCGIGGPGGEAMARTIIRSSSVRELYLRGNAIGPQGVIAISHALAKNTTLQRLDLSDNSFGIDLEALESLRDGIEANESLNFLDVQLNSLVPPGPTMLLEAIQAKANIIDFRMYERVGDELFRSTLDAVAANKKAQMLGKKKKKKKAKKKA